MPLSNLTAYVSVAENSAATPGLFDSRFNTVYANVLAVDTTVSLVSTYVSQVSTALSIVSGSGLSGLINVQSAAYGALGTGSADDRAAFFSANSSTATQAVLYVPSASSVYKIGSSITISGTVYPIRGSVLRPSSGATINHRGGIQAGPYQIWDLSLGGVDFTNNREIEHFLPHWFGFKGDGTVDEAPALVRMCKMLPNSARVHFPAGSIINLNSTWTVGPGRQDLQFYAGRDPRQADLTPGDGQVHFTWGGAAGGTMVYVDSCTFCAFDGFTCDMGTADTWFTFDGANGHITSSNRVRNFAVDCTTPRSTQKVFQFSPTISTNGDFQGLERGVMNSFNNQPSNSVVSTSAGSTLIRSADFTSSFWSGKRIRAEGAGAGGGILDTTIDSTSGGGVAVMHVAATGTTSNAYALLGGCIGTAVYCGPNANAHKTLFDDVQIAGFNIGIDFQNGSYCARQMQFTNNELNWQVASAGLPCQESDGIRCEFSRQHLTYGGNAPLWITNVSLDVEQVTPSGAFVDDQGSGVVTVQNASIENTLPGTGTNVFAAAQNRTLKLIDVRTASSISLARFVRIAGVGATAADQFTMIDCKTISDVIGGTLYGFPVFGHNHGDVGDIGKNQWMPFVDQTNNLFGVLAVKNDGTSISTFNMFRTFTGSRSAVDPASLGPGLEQVGSTVTVTGAVAGDHVRSVAHSANTNTFFYGVVTTSDVVQTYQRNPSAATVDVGSGTLTAVVERPF